MTQKQTQKMLPSITHFANGGYLWYYSQVDKKWCIQSEYVLMNEQGILKIFNIIEDSHFKSRKAYALGEEIESSCNYGKATYMDDETPSWDDDCVYRPKPKDPVYEWQWIYTEDGYIVNTSEKYYEVYPHNGWTKFEPSKRIKK